MRKKLLALCAGLCLSSALHASQDPEPTLQPLSLEEVQVFEATVTNRFKVALIKREYPKTALNDFKSFSDKGVSLLIEILLAHKKNALTLALDCMQEKPSLGIPFIRFLYTKFIINPSTHEHFKDALTKEPQDWSRPKNFLTIALHWGNWEALREILLRLPDEDNLVDWNELIDGKAPLHHAVRELDLDYVMFLVNRRGINPIIQDTKGNTPLHYVASMNNVEKPEDHTTLEEITDLLLACKTREELNARLNVRNRSDLSAFHNAVMKGNLPIVRHLLGYNPALSCIPDSVGTTPLHFGVLFDNVELVNTLLTHGADQNLHSINKHRSTPLHYASMKNAQMTALLLQHGAGEDLHTADIDGLTPLHMAAGNGRADIVSLLLQYGAWSDSGTKDKKGRTPLMLAENTAHSSQTTSLLRHYPCHDYDCMHAGREHGRLLVSEHPHTLQPANPTQPNIKLANPPPVNREPMLLFDTTLNK